MAKTKWTEAKVFEQLRHVFPDGPHVRIPQVRDSTGFSKGGKRRYADGLVLSVYPSRGLWLAGIEIKVSRADWKKELSDPAKSATIQKYCNYWYVAAPEGLIDKNELPETWGLIEVNGTTAKIAVRRDSAEAAPPDISFVVSIFRAALSNCVHESTMAERVNKRVDDIRDELSKLREESFESHCETRRLQRLEEAVKRFEKDSGIRIERYGFGDQAQALAYIQATRINCVEEAILECAEKIRKAKESTEKEG